MQNGDEEQLKRRREMEKEQIRREEQDSNLSTLMGFIDIQFLIVYPLAYIYVYFQTIRPDFGKYQFQLRQIFRFFIYSN